MYYDAAGADGDTTGNLKLGRGWLDGFYRRHPEVKTKYSKGLNYVRTVKGNDIKMLEHFYKMLLEVVAEFSIKAGNTYNIDEIGFMLGISAIWSVVWCMRRLAHTRRRARPITAGT